MAEISLKQLKAFCSVAASGNLGISAEQLFLTRGAVSQAIKGLEEQLQTELFERRQQRLYLNRQGQLLRPLAQQMLAQHQSILGLFVSGESMGELRLGASHTIGNYLLPNLLASSLSPLLSQARISLGNSTQLQQQLLDYELDLALVESENIAPSLTRLLWRQDEMVLIVPPNSDWVAETIDWDVLSRQRWVLRERHSGSREQFDYHLAPKLTTAAAVTELGSLEAVVRSVMAGVGVSLVSRLACEQALQQGWVRQQPLPQPLHRRLSLVCQPGSAALPVVKATIEALQCLTD
ncbi:LysR substrate-binding domain-containing protein [Ferrimonas sp. SCSIO 43195]|uniref:LysR substrate-binding domain-containing protein n=1 Tax=Ferrimonas sp. SCSIO 43195 TaxID=2822844 RepID=UPI002074F2D7|nr:LysR substrate-binding domain-containing protein [Ferrimonas sp. SCSIO 43195]USD36131.1 LysR family transcriptional regulator [Ferrimonas sp. SCSIO 43195]